MHVKSQKFALTDLPIILPSSQQVERATHIWFCICAIIVRVRPFLPTSHDMTALSERRRASSVYATWRSHYFVHHRYRRKPCLRVECGITQAWQQLISDHVFDVVL